MTHEEIDTLRERMDSLIGSTRWQTALSLAMGNSRAIVNGWFSFSETNLHRYPPQQFLIALEFLEVTPVNKWPVRWKRLKGLKLIAKNRSN